MELTEIGLDLVTFAGPLSTRLDAILNAGFTQVMLKGSDLTTELGGFPAGIDRLSQSGLRCTGLQVLRDFEGTSGRFRAFKVAIAAEMLAMCAAVRSPILLTCSATSPHTVNDVRDIVRDLRMLAAMAADYGVKIAYEALSWGRTVSESSMAWQLVSEVDHDNLGIALDAFHHIATNTPASALQTLVPEKILLVQLADFLWPKLDTVEERITTARHFRVFPGEGVHDRELCAFIGMLHSLDYRGDYSLEVFNDDYLQLPLSAVVERARRSATWVKAQWDAFAAFPTASAA